MFYECSFLNSIHRIHVCYWYYTIQCIYSITMSPFRKTDIFICLIGHHVWPPCNSLPVIENGGNEWQNEEMSDKFYPWDRVLLFVIKREKLPRYTRCRIRIILGGHKMSQWLGVHFYLRSYLTPYSATFAPADLAAFWVGNSDTNAPLSLNILVVFHLSISWLPFSLFRLLFLWPYEERKGENDLYEGCGHRNNIILPTTKITYPNVITCFTKWQKWVWNLVV